MTEVLGGHITKEPDWTWGLGKVSLPSGHWDNPQVEGNRLTDFSSQVLKKKIMKKKLEITNPFLASVVCAEKAYTKGIYNFTGLGES